MKLETAKALVDTAYDMGHTQEDISLREDYSGRGMYGKSTAAVVVDNIAFLACIAFELGASLESRGGTAIDEIGGAMENISQDLKNLRSDSMGRGYVVY